MQFFAGEGYSSGFTRNMGEVIARLKNEGQMVVLTEREDCICAACPNNRRGCVSAEKVQRFDKTVLDLCGLSAGETIAAEEFFSAVRRNILESGKFFDVCTSCQWFGLCTKIYESRK